MKHDDKDRRGYGADGKRRSDYTADGIRPEYDEDSNEIIIGGELDDYASRLERHGARSRKQATPTIEYNEDGASSARERRIAARKKMAEEAAAAEAASAQEAEDITPAVKAADSVSDNAAARRRRPTIERIDSEVDASGNVGPSDVIEVIAEVADGSAAVSAAKAAAGSVVTIEESFEEDAEAFAAASARAADADDLVETAEDIGEAIEEKAEAAVEKAADIKEAAADKLSDIGEAIEEKAEAAVEKAADIKDAAADKLSDIGEAIEEKAEAAVEKAAEIKDAAADKLSDIGEAIEEKAAAAVEKAADIKDAAADKLSDIGEAIEEKAEAAVEKAADIKDAVADRLSDIGEAVKDTAADVKAAVSEKISDVRDAVSDGADAALDAGAARNAGAAAAGISAAAGAAVSAAVSDAAAEAEEEIDVLDDLLSDFGTEGSYRYYEDDEDEDEDGFSSVNDDYFKEADESEEDEDYDEDESDEDEEYDESDEDEDYDESDEDEDYDESEEDEEYYESDEDDEYYDESEEEEEYYDESDGDEEYYDESEEDEEYDESDEDYGEEDEPYDDGNGEEYTAEDDGAYSVDFTEYTGEGDYTPPPPVVKPRDLDAVRRKKAAKAEDESASFRKEFLVSASPHIHCGETTRVIMGDVIIALIPALIASVLWFGWRALMLTIVCVVSCVATEYICRRIMKRRQTVGDLSAVVTGILLAFCLPPELNPLFAVIGSIVAIAVVKQMFGGIGQNFANPAATARIVMMLSFPAAMTTWSRPFYYYLDAVSEATPLSKLSDPNAILPTHTELLVGYHSGCIGETCAIALLLGGAYLLLRGVISWEIPVSFMGAVVIFSMIAGQDPIYQLLSGGVILGALFMATDYVTSPVNRKGRIIFGLGCGILTMLIRLYGNMPEGVSFAILLMNILTPHIDRLTLSTPFGEERAKA